MRLTSRPLAFHLTALVLASLVPAAGVAAALAASLYRPIPATALVLAAGVMALGAGVAVSIRMARGLQRAIATGLAAAATPMPPARRSAAERGDWRWDLATGVIEWSQAAPRLFRIAGDSVPSRARLLALAHPSSRAALVAWLAGLARGEDAAPLEFRITRGDGTSATIRATATAERDGSGAPLAIAGTFAEVADAAPAAATPPAPPAPPSDVNALLYALAATMRERARGAGIDFGAAIMPQLGPLPGPAHTLAAALAILGESVLTFMPRGGRVLLRADMDASGGVRVAFGCDRPAAADGVKLAGQLVELSCGADAARRLEEARALVALNGATLAVAPRQGGGETVTIMLPGAPAARQAA